MECPTPLLPTLTAPIDLWPYKSWAKGNLARGEQKKKSQRLGRERRREKQNRGRGKTQETEDGRAKKTRRKTKKNRRKAGETGE